MQTINTGYQRSGKNSRVAVGGVVLAHSKFNVGYKGNDLDTVNFTSFSSAAPQGTAGGTTGRTPEEGILGTESCDIGFGGDFDAHANLLDPTNALNPPAVFPRDDLKSVAFWLNVADGTFWAFPWARVRSATNSSDVRGKVSFEASGMNQGPFTAPLGSV